MPRAPPGTAMLGALGSKVNAAVSKYSDVVTARRGVAEQRPPPPRVGEEGGAKGGPKRLDQIFAALDAQAKAVPLVCVP